MNILQQTSLRRSVVSSRRDLPVSYLAIGILFFLAVPSHAMTAHALPDRVERKVERARPMIHQRLQAVPACHELFTTLGHDAEKILSSLRLVSASLVQERKYCRRKHAAFTMIGSPVIYFCRSFARLPDRQAAVVLIHEALHSAGLRERPLDREAMDSAAINQMVATSCQL